MRIKRNTNLCLAAILTAISISCSQNKQQADYQPGVKLSILIADARSQVYLDMVETMTIQDLNDKWKRASQSMPRHSLVRR